MGRPKKSLSLEQDILKSAIIDDSSIVTSEGGKSVPDRRSPDWSKHVLSHLEPDEQDKDGKFPKTDALPRLIELLIGPILRSESYVMVHPTTDNNMRIVTQHTLLVHDHLYDMERTVTGVGEASELKLVPPYNLYPAAISSTRALGRACKMMLQLKNVTTAEEIGGSVDEKDESLITPSQIKGIEFLTKKLDIDMDKYLHSRYGAYNDVREVTKEFGSSVMADLNKMRDGTLEIPEEFRNAS